MGRSEETTNPATQQTNLTSPSVPHSHAPNQGSFTRNNQLTTDEGDSISPERGKLYPIVLIKPLPSESNPKEYVTISDEQEKIEVSQKRKREVIHEDLGIIAETKDQRAISNEAVNRLKEFVRDLFEADDRLQSEASGSDIGDMAQYFVPVYQEERESYTISPALHVKLETLLQKVISLGRYSDAPLEYLCRIQSLCEGALSSAESADFHAELASGSDDELKWTQGIETFDLGLRSARTILRTMVGGREEKEIYSEELLQHVLRVIGKVLNSCIIPVVESRNTGSNSALFETASTHRKALSQLSYDANKVMGLLAELLNKIDISEVVFNPLEFLAVGLIFVENAPSEKESVLGVPRFESIRRTAMDIIAEMFSRYPQQRRNLFDGILASLQKLPVNRPHARQYKLVEGKSIQLVSALIMRLVQTSATPVIAKKGLRRKVLDLHRDAQSDDDESQEERADSSETTDSDGASSDEAPENQITETMARLAKDASKLSDNAARDAQVVVGFYVQRAMTAPKTGDQPYRHLLDMFAEDLIMVLGLPEWPAAELLLRALLIRMIEIAENKKYNTPAKSMSLELLGLMGSAISELVSSTQQKAATLENQESTLSGYLGQLLDDYMEGKLEMSELLQWEGPYHAVLEYLEQMGSGDKQAASAQGYILTQWSKAVASGHLLEGADAEKLAKRLQKMLSSAKWNPVE